LPYGISFSPAIFIQIEYAADAVTPQMPPLRQIAVFHHYADYLRFRGRANMSTSRMLRGRFLRRWQPRRQSRFRSRLSIACHAITSRQPLMIRRIFISFHYSAHLFSPISYERHCRDGIAYISLAASLRHRFAYYLIPLSLPDIDSHLFSSMIRRERTED